MCSSCVGSVIAEDLPTPHMQRLFWQVCEADSRGSSVLAAGRVVCGLAAEPAHGGVQQQRHSLLDWRRWPPLARPAQAQEWEQQPTASYLPPLRRVQGRAMQAKCKHSKPYRLTDSECNERMLR